MVSEAQKLETSAREALKKGNLELAKQLVEQALKIEPLRSTEVLYQEIRIQNEKRNLKSNSSQTTRQYTNEQLELVNKILCVNNLYKVLDVSTDATADQIKKNYKKFILKLHPDKNSAPKAGDAFKRVAKAYEILSNPTERARYNITGMEDATKTQRTYTYAQNTHFDPVNELFRQFMQSSSGSNFTFESKSRSEPEYKTTTIRFADLQKIVMFLFVVFWIFATLFGRSFENTPDYSFTPSTYLNFRVLSQENHVPYYVSSKFVRKNPINSASRQQIDNEIEYIYFKNDCERILRPHRVDLEYFRLKSNSAEFRSKKKEIDSLIKSSKACQNAMRIHMKNPLLVKKILENQTPLSNFRIDW